MLEASGSVQFSNQLEPVLVMLDLVRLQPPMLHREQSLQSCVLVRPRPSPVMSGSSGDFPPHGPLPSQGGQTTCNLQFRPASCLLQ